MESNTHSDGLAALAAVVDQLAAQDRDGLADHVRAQRVLVLRRLLDRLEGHWLAELAEVDARGAAGADQDVRFGSTAGWLRTRLHAGATTAGGWVKTARALFRGPLTGTAQALRQGELSVAHASVLAAGTHDLPSHTTAEAEPVLVEAARRLDPPRLRRLVTHLRLVADPDDADRQAQRRHEQRGLWLSPTLDNMIAVDGLLKAEAGQILLSALEPLARPASAEDDRTGGQRRADALAELARRQLEGGRLPQTGGVRPQLTVLVDLDNLALLCRAHHRAVHEGGWRLARGPDGRADRHPTPPHRPPEDTPPQPDQRAPTATPVPGGRRGLHLHEGPHGAGAGTAHALTVARRCVMRDGTGSLTGRPVPPSRSA
jgi:hypothetical protein